jgi:diguanylate cyclase (GGDEF)-like protein/PAS domain S-box-containing protein
MLRLEETSAGNSIVGSVELDEEVFISLCDETKELLEFIKKALLSSRCPEIPEHFKNDEVFNEIYDYISMIRAALRHFAQGNLKWKVNSRGFIAGCLKELQAHLRHLTWHADRMAAGDFAQHIDFMGDFAESFNNMSREFFGALSALRESEANLRATTHDLYISEERWKLAMTCTQDGILDIDVKAKKAFFSKRLWEILRYPPKDDTVDFDFNVWGDMVLQDDREKWNSLILTLNNPEQDDESRKKYIEFRIKGHDGKYRWIGVSYMFLRDDEGSAYRFVGVCEDIQERHEREEAIRMQATHDQLTGLPNRYLYKDRLLQQMVMAKRNNSALILVVWDLDGFKGVNDTYGHLAGDALLVAVAKLMRSCMREMDTLARFGGDEFVMLLASPGENEEDVAMHATSRIFGALKKKIDVGEAKVHIGASCGISFFPKHSSDAEELFNRADKALYSAKRTGKNKALIWTPEIEKAEEE